MPSAARRLGESASRPPVFRKLSEAAIKAAWLRAALRRAAEAGIDPDRTILDPGIGFGKTVAHNLELLRRLGELTAIGRPLMLGVSRKSMFGHLLDLPVDGRDQASALMAGLCRGRGAALVRVHDVALTRQAIDLATALDDGWDEGVS